MNIFGCALQYCYILLYFWKLQTNRVEKEQNGVKPQTKLHVHEFCSANPSCVSGYFF